MTPISSGIGLISIRATSALGKQQPTLGRVVTKLRANAENEVSVSQQPLGRLRGERAGDADVQGSPAKYPLPCNDVANSAPTRSASLTISSLAFAAIAPLPAMITGRCAAASFSITGASKSGLGVSTLGGRNTVDGR